ncbi:MAG: DUF721 domain-containing protein [bacterium]|nr:MAG: DUF721 domain-containing protein [bacterium]
MVTGRGKKQPSRRVGAILPGVLRNLGLEGKMEETRLLQQWPEIVGEAVSRRSRPREIRRGLLFIEVADNVWMQEIRFHQKEILARIKECFPKLALKGIRLELDKKRDG